MPLPETDGNSAFQFNPAAAAAPVDPERFAAEILGVTLWDKQRAALQALTRRQRVAVKSGNGLGKDFTAAVAALWFVYAHNPAIVLSTAPTFRQVRNVLWRQLHALHRRANPPLGGQLLDTRWELAADRYALGFSATGADRFQGFHCPNLLVIVDEAEGVADDIYEGIEGVITSANARLMLIGNPMRPSGGFYHAFHRERALYETITISALESPNVLARRIVIPGMPTAEWVEERRNSWGEGSAAFQSRILGEFPKQGDDNLIALDDIEEAQYAPGELPPPGDRRSDDIIAMLVPGWSEHTPVALGVDVARYGPDRSVALLRRGYIVEDIKVFPKSDTMALTGAVIAMARERRPDRVNVDEVGVGAGVLDRLREQGIPARGINGASAPARATECANLRAEGYWNLAERFQNRRIRIPQDAELAAELSELRYTYNSRGKLLLESKETIRNRSRNSPDKADALMLAFLDEAPPVDYRL